MSSLSLRLAGLLPPGQAVPWMAATAACPHRRRWVSPAFLDLVSFLLGKFLQAFVACYSCTTLLLDMPLDLLLPSGVPAGCGAFKAPPHLLENSMPILVAGTFHCTVRISYVHVQRQGAPAAAAWLRVTLRLHGWADSLHSPSAGRLAGRQAQPQPHPLWQPRGATQVRHVAVGWGRTWMARINMSTMIQPVAATLR